MSRRPWPARCAALVVAAAARLVPASRRPRWREEWLGEIDAAPPDRRLVLHACGSVADALASRRVVRQATSETAAFRPRGLRWDLRYSARLIRRAPGFTLAAIASLSIGIAATTTTFSALNALLFRSLPGVKESTRLVHVYTTASGAAGSSSSEAMYEHYRQSLTSFSGMAAFTRMSLAVGTGGEPVVTTVLAVSPNYFSLLGTLPAAGMLLDERADDQHVVVVSHDFAVRHYGSAAAAPGLTLSLSGQSCQVIGVVPPSFVGVRPGGFGEDGMARPQLWLSRGLRDAVAPSEVSRVNPRLEAGTGTGTWVEIVARLRPDVSLGQARAEAASVAQTLGRSAANGWPVLVPLGRGPHDQPGDIATIVALTLAIPFVVLAVGCANTANLQLARAAQRQAEIAVRRSLGAARGQIVRQLLVESVFVAGLSGVVAIGGTVAATRLLAGFMPVPFPVDWRVLAFALLVVLLTGLGFGIAPALSATRGDLTRPLKDSTGAPAYRRSRLRSGLVISQVALSILLLVMAALFTRTLSRLNDVGAQQGMSQVAAARINLGLLKYSAAQGRALQDELLARIARAPGVTAAAIAPFDPFGGSTGLTYRKTDGTTEKPYGYTNGGAPLGRFIETAGIRVVRGRGFSDEDRQGTPKVALVSETLARRIEPSGNVLGMHLLVGDAIAQTHDVAIVGITEDTPFRAVRGEVHAMFLPAPLNYDQVFSLWVRAAGDPATVLPHIRAIVRDLDPRLPVGAAGTADWWRAREVGPIRWVASSLGAMGALAILLAGAGLYAVMSYLVAQRRHEMAVRLALGATPRHLARLVVGHSMRLAVTGLAVGIMLSAIAAQLMRVMLLGVSPLDPFAFTGVAALLLAVAVVSTLVPALRVSRLDPLEMLRRS